MNIQSQSESGLALSLSDLSGKKPITGADVLDEMAATYRERNKVYGDNFRVVGPVMELLHPHGITLKDAKDHEIFHLWSLLVVKLTRFSQGNLTHIDSIHDLGVYAAMIEAILKERASNV